MTQVTRETPLHGSFLGAFYKYVEIARMALANRFVYLGDAISRPLFFAVILFVFFQLWQKVFTQGQPLVDGFGALETLWYLVMTEAIILSVPRLEGRVDVEVKTGSIAYIIGRPCNYLLYHLSFGLGEAFPLFLLNLSVGILVALFLIGPFAFKWIILPFLLLSVLGAFVLHFYITMCLGLLAFWVEDATPFFWVYSKMLFILGGLLIPLSFFPSWLQEFAQALPFHNVLYGPAKLFVQGELALVSSLLSWQIIWIFVFAALAHGMFTLGSRRVHIHGG